MKTLKNKTPILFLLTGLISLLLGLSWGILGSLQYFIPELLKSVFPFSVVRPLHVTSVLSWIILTASGGIYYYLASEKKEIKSSIQKLHFLIFLLTGTGIYLTLLVKQFGGREYFEFMPVFTIFILLGWILFAINYLSAINFTLKNKPLYWWMWFTGILFMIYHLIEAHLWQIPAIRQHFIKDITVQWKSYGSLAGCWNMLVYGTLLYLMCKIKGNDKGANSKTAFFFYFLGLTNLMFGWAHHTYFIPTQPWIRIVSYAVSMSEWLVILHLVRGWKSDLTIIEKAKHKSVINLIRLVDFWVLGNVILALFMSIPLIQIFTHGTHITVAHSMGTTIGINTNILLASITFIGEQIYQTSKPLREIRYQNTFNLFVFLFISTLSIAGLEKGFHLFYSGKDHSQIQELSQPYYIGFALFGIGILISAILLTLPKISLFMSYIFNKNPIQTIDNN